MIIAATPWWYLARATGLVAAVLLAMSLIWGVLLSTRLLKPVKRPAWLLDLHRWLGGLTVGFVVLHLIGLVADSYVHFDLKTILVPFASEWRPAAVTWGVVGLYLLAIVQFSSWSEFRIRVPRKVWHTLHLLSFPLLWVVAMHAGTSGTDVGNRVYVISMLVLIAVIVFVVLYRILAGTGRGGKSRTTPPARTATGRGATRARPRPNQKPRSRQAPVRSRR